MNDSQINDLLNEFSRLNLNIEKLHRCLFMLAFGIDLWEHDPTSEEVSYYKNRAESKTLIKEKIKNGEME